MELLDSPPGPGKASSTAFCHKIP